MFVTRPNKSSLISPLPDRNAVLALLLSIVVPVFAGFYPQSANAAEQTKETPTLILFRPSNGIWYSQSQPEAGAFRAVRWGSNTDRLVPADYDGDGDIDLAVYRPENGTWYICQSRDGRALELRLGDPNLGAAIGDAVVPVPADYDGDGRADIAIWYPGSGKWTVTGSKNEFRSTRTNMTRLGRSGDVPIQGDYDGDGRADLAVFRPAENRWYVIQSSTEKQTSLMFGSAGDDILVPADYDGDGKTDPAVYRAGTWLVRESASGETVPFKFGFDDGLPAPADYDGDGQTDFAVFRQGVWYIYESAEPRFRAMRFGNDDDIPAVATVVRKSLADIN
jgi:hypothetical protein